MEEINVLLENKGKRNTRKLRIVNKCEENEFSLKER